MSGRPQSVPSASDRVGDTVATRRAAAESRSEIVAETARHAGHADVLRETIDGEVGLRPADPNIPGRSPDDWAAYRAMVEAEAGRA